MTKRLLPLKIYRLRAGSLVRAELEAYSAGLDFISFRLDKIKREMFIKTACDKGLDMWEDLLWGQRYPALEVGTRRNMILAALSIRADGFSHESIETAILAVGVKAEIQEFPEEERLFIEATDYNSELKGYSNIFKRIEKVLPAHLIFDINFGLVTWEMLDAANHSWEEIDAQGFTFDEIGNLTPEELVF
jgi:hypothetical protein